MTVPKPPGTVYTIGHSTRPIDEFVALLAQVQVTCLVDIRSIPGSRAVPQFNSDVFPGALAAAGITYVHLATLGGRRRHAKGAPPSANIYWRVPAFRNYADHAETPAFREGIDALLALAGQQPCAIMCAEAVWWRCHRRIVADYLLARGIPVQHIMGIGKLVDATLTPGARILPDGTIRYDNPATEGEP
jgi:uncharacterized protein (DUF488 family)